MGERTKTAPKTVAVEGGTPTTDAKPATINPDGSVSLTLGSKDDRAIDTRTRSDKPVKLSPESIATLNKLRDLGPTAHRLALYQDGRQIITIDKVPGLNIFDPKTGDVRDLTPDELKHIKSLKLLK